MRHFPLLSLQVSSQLGVIIFLIHAAALAAGIFCAAPWLMKVVSGLVCFCSCYILLRKYVFLAANSSIMVLSAKSAGDWQLLDKKGRTYKAQLCGNSVVTPLGMILNFTCLEAKGKKTVLIVPQTVGATAFRRSVVYLQTARSKSAGKIFLRQP